MPSMRNKLAWFASLAVLCASEAFAQQAVPAQTYGESIEVSIVNLDVVVTDRSGKPVHGLTAADFEVKEDGKPQAITNFAEFSSSEGAAAAEGQLQAAGGGAKTTPVAGNDKRTVIVFLERFKMPKKETDRFFDEIRTMLHQVVRPGDAAAIVTWNYVMKVRQDFTSDLSKLDKALDEAKADIYRVEMDPETVLLQNAFLQDLLEEATLQQTDGASAGAPSALFSGLSGARQALVDIRRKSVALNTLINTIAGIPGKKSLLLATNRYSQYAGAEYYDGEMPPEIRTEFDTFRIRKEVADNANSAGVTIYAIYPRGVEQVVFANVEEPQRRDTMVIGPPGQPTTVQRNEDRYQQDMKKLGRSGLLVMNETAAIDELAKQTGGIAAWGKTDIIRLIDVMREDISSYYSIAFRSTNGSANARKVSVSTKNGSYNVRTRREYVPKTDSMKMAERVRSSMYGRIEPPQVTFEVRTGDVRRNKRKYFIPVQIRVPVAELTALPTAQGRQGTFSIFAASGGLLGVMSDVVEKAQNFSIKTGEEEKAKTAVITYDLEIVSDSRADRIAVGVMDETSKETGVVVVKMTPPAKK